MGFFSNLADALSHPKLADPVRGTAQVVSASMPPHQSGGGGMCSMSLVITIPDQPSVAVTKASIVTLAKWPMPGTLLPVLAERTDPKRFHIVWDEVPTGRDRGAQQAQQVAERLNGMAGGSANATAAGAAPRTTTSVTVNGAPATPADIAAFEAMTGMDLDGDGVVGGSGAPSTHQAPTRTVTAISGDALAQVLGKLAGSGAAPAAEEDTVSRLERAAALYESGALTHAEFEAAKRRILGDEA